LKKYIGTTIRKNVNDPTAGDTPAVGVNVTIKNYPSNSAATVYSDDGVTVATQPLVTDAAGKFEFYAADGRYNIDYDFNGDITSDTDVAIFDDIEKASLSDAQAATDDERYMTPSKVKSYVDQFGIGVSDLPNISSFNATTLSGLYGFNSGSLGRPSFTNGLCLSATPDNNDRMTQVAVSTVGGTYQFGFRALIAGAGDWIYMYDTSNLAYSQNVSGGTITSNSTTAGSSLSPTQTGTWRNVSGNDILNNGYGLFQRV